MKRSFSLIALLSIACGPPAAAGPDLIMTGGRVYVSATGQEVYSALAIDDDRVVALGDDYEMRALAGDDTQEMSLDGTVILPGMGDAWVDIEALGRRESELDLRGVAAPREVQVRLRTAPQGADGEWIIGWGWDETVWPRPEMPSATVLDEVVADRPVVLYRRVGRTAWINGAARALLDSGDDGTGVVGDPELAQLESLMPEATPQNRRERLAAGLRAVASAGITSVATAPLDAEAMRLLVRMANEDGLPVRVELRAHPAALTAGQAPAAPQLRLRGIGVVLDGPFGIRAAALAADYADGSGAAATADVNALDTACAAAEAAGLPLDVLAHGDAAVTASLRCASVAEGRGMIVGADVIPVDGLPASVRVAVVPLRLRHDFYWLEDRLGPERILRAHPYRDLATSGNLFALASAAPGYDLAPMAALRFIYTRRDTDGYPLDGWQPRQRLSVADGLRLALQSFAGGEPRRLEPGAVADLTVWSSDPFDTPEVSLGRALPMLTVVAGRVTFSRPLITPDFSVEP